MSSRWRKAREEDAEHSDGNDSDMTNENDLSRTLDGLGERRPAVRLSSLKNLIDQLTASFQDEWIERYQETISYHITSLVRNSSNEAILACQLYGIVIITLGHQSARFAQLTTPTIKQLFSDSSQNPTVRAAAVAANAIGTFLSIDADTSDEIDRLESMMLSNLNESLLTAVIESWSLLASSVPPMLLVGTLMPQSLPKLVKMLHHESVDVCTAAGEAIALLLVALHEEHRGNELEEDTDLGRALDDDGRVIAVKQRRRASSIAADGGSRGSAVAAIASIVDYDELNQHLTTLANSASRARGRRERAKQRSVFRDVLAALENQFGEDGPSEELQLGAARFVFEGYPALIQLGAIRDVLGKGLPFQLMVSYISPVLG